jgi:YD repeat-containing protein
MFALSPSTVSMPHPDLQQDCCWGHPFNHHVPDCARFEFDDQGMPLRTRQVGEATDLFRFIYDAGRVVAIEIDEVPSCVSNDFGDQSPCGVPDGNFDRMSPIRWEGRRVTAGRAEWLFDAEGRLREWDTGERSGRNTFDGDYVSERIRDDGFGRITTRFHYDGDERLVLAERSFSDQTEQLRWEYDAHGWPTRRTFPSGVVEYDNEYDGDNRLVRREIRPIESPTLRGAPTTYLRRHDVNGLLVEEKREASGGSGGGTTVWERDNHGVPLAIITDGHRIDQSCLEPLARHFR